MADYKVGGTQIVKVMTNGVQVWPSGATSGTYCIDIDDPLLLPVGATLEWAPLDGASVVATPPDARITFDGVDAVVMTGPTGTEDEGFLSMIFDIDMDLTFTGGDGTGGLLDAQMRVYDLDDVLINTYVAESNNAGEAFVTGTASDIYTLEPWRLRLVLTNGYTGDLTVSGGFCLTWRVDF